MQLTLRDNLFGELKATLRSLQVKVSRQNEDIEKGKSFERPDDSKAQTVAVFLKRLAIMIVLSGLIAGAAAIWYYFGWQIFLAYSIPACLVLLIAINYSWCYVAAVTAPRDIG